MKRAARGARGFSAVELLSVLLVMATLAMVAVTSYRHYGTRVRRMEGRQLLLDAVLSQQRYQARHGKPASDVEALQTPLLSTGGHYELAMSAQLDDEGFLLVARPRGPQVRDACGELAIDHLGRTFPAPEDKERHRHGACW